MAFNHDDKIIINRRKGDSSDPFVEKIESHIINNDGTVILSEIPNKFHKVVVTSTEQDWYEIDKGELGMNTYRVDYANKIVTFHQSNIGKQLTFKFKGTGMVYFPPTMIYTQENNGNVTETLADIIKKGDEAIENVKAVEQVVTDGNVAIEQINASIITADGKITELQSTIDGADVRITDKIVEIDSSANTAITNKITDIQTQYDTKELEWDGEIDTKLINLDDAIQSANTTITKVDNKATLADQKITELQTKIDGADTQITDKIVEIDGKGVTAINDTVANMQATFDTNVSQWDSEIEIKKGTIDTKVSEVTVQVNQWELKEQARNTKENERVIAEQTRTGNEDARKLAEIDRIDSEGLRKISEVTREQQETERQNNTQVAITNTETVITNAINSTTSATNAGQYANEKGDYANQQGLFANEKAILANEKASLVDTEIGKLTQLKTETQTATTSANSSATEAQTQAQHAKTQGDFAKIQGDYAKAQGDLINDILDNGSVASVNGFTGAVILTANDVNAYTKEETNAKITDLVGSAPETLDTLHELAEALGNDSNFATTISTQLGKKVDKVVGKQLSTEDYTTSEKSKLAGIEEGANNYTHPTSHPASMITQDVTHRMVSDTQISDWDSKETVTGSQSKADQAETNAKNASVSKTQLGIAGGVATLNAQGKVIDSTGALVEGKVKSVNQTQPDSNGNITISIPTKTSELTNDSNYLTSIPNGTTGTKGIVQLSSSTSSTSTTLASTPSAVKSAYDKAVSAETTANDASNKMSILTDNFTTHTTEYMPHDSELNQYASGKDANGFYTVVDYKRIDGTLYLTSTLSNPNLDGNYQTIKWQFYNNTGTVISLTKTWTITYDENGIAITKVVA